MPPDNNDLAYDLFISHTTANRDWVNGYLRPALGLSPSRIITPDNFDLGASVVSEFERAVTTSRYSLLVISPAYLNDQWSVLGEHLASYASVKEQRDRVVPLLLQKCELPLRVAFRVSLDCTDDDNWEAEIARLRNLLSEPEPAKEYLACPYPGMVPFRADDARFFYGRDAEIKKMLLQLRGQRRLFVIGPSGSGKSSLVFAGVLPKLTDQSHFTPHFWTVVSMRPGSEPTERLINLVNRPPGEFEQGLQELLAKQPHAQRLLLVIDQFEETFTLAKQADRRTFIDALQKLMAVDICTLLITMRADFYADLMRSDLWPLDPAERIEVAPLHGAALRKAIEQPANDCGVYFEAGLLERLLADAAEEPGALPLVQETMVLLWSAMRRRLLPLAAYNQLGSGEMSGLAVAIATKADATIALSNNFSAEQQALARRIFLRLVQFGEGRLDTRRQQPISALRSRGDDADLFDSTLAHLTENRLLTLSGEETGTESVVDISHEALISAWPTFRKWLSERRSAEQTRRRLEDKATEWAERVRSERGGGLLDVVELTEAELWTQSSDGRELGSSTELASLIQASSEKLAEDERAREEIRRKELESAQALAQEQQRRAEIEKSAATRLRKRAFALAAVMVLSMFLAGLAWYQYRQTANQIPLTISRQLAAQADAHLNERLDTALLLAVEAYETSRTLEARKVILAALQHSPRAKAFLHSQQGSVRDMRFTNDNKILVTANADGTVSRWDLDKRELLGSPVKGPVEGADKSVLSPDLRTVASVSSKTKELILWDASSGLPIGEPLKDQHGGFYSDIAFSPDGRKLAHLYGMQITLFDVATRETIAHMDTKTPQRLAVSVAFSHDGRTLAVAGSASTVDVLDVEKKEWIGKPLVGHNWWVMSVAFKPNGETIAIGNRDGTVGKWGKEVITPDWTETVSGGHAQSVSKVLFSPDGEHLASGGEDGRVVLSGTITDSGGIPFGGHGNKVTALAFSPDSQTLASAGEDGRIILWTTVSEIEMRGSSDQPDANNLALSPDGKTVAGTNATSLVLWDLSTRKAIEKPLEGSARGSLSFSQNGKTLTTTQVDEADAFADSTESPPGSETHTFTKWDTRTYEVLETRSVRSNATSLVTATSVDGKTLAFGNKDNTISIWDTANGQNEQILKGHTGPVRCLAFSPDGTILASGSDDKSIILWSVSSRKELGQPITGHTGAVSALAFSADGTVLASGAKTDERIILWNVGTRTRSGEIFKAHKAEVQNLAFDPDGVTLASSGKDTESDWTTTTILWDVATRSKVGSVSESGPLLFSSTGEILVTAGISGNIIFWDFSLDALRSRACSIANRNLSPAEWSQFMGNNVSYEKTCPNLPPGQ